MSSGRPNLRKGYCRRIFSSLSRRPSRPRSPMMRWFISSYRSCMVKPGLTMLTVMPYLPTSRARPLVKPMTPALEAEYQAHRGSPTRAASDVTLTMRPYCLATMCSMTERVQFIVPRRLTLIVSTQTSRPTSQSSPKTRAAAALLTRMSTPWKASRVCSHRRCVSSYDMTSARTNRALPPDSLISLASFPPFSSFRSTITTLAPSAANVRTMARPIP